MKIIWVLSLLGFSLTVICQESENLRLPEPAEISRIEISKTSMHQWYQPAELLSLLPQFVASEGTYGEKAIPFQYGKFILKNGKEINWMANFSDSILLYKESVRGRKEQLFVLPQKNGSLFHIWDADGKEGFIDINGSLILKPQFEAVGEFSEGLAPALIGDKWGYINEKGEVVIKPRWPQSGSSFHEGLAIVTEQVHWTVIDDSNYYAYKCGYINRQGEYVIEPKFRQSCGTFSDGLARIEVDLQGDEYEQGKGWIGFMDKQGNWAIKPQLFQASNFREGFALVQSEPLPKDLYIKIPGTDLVRNNANRQSLYLIDKTGRKASDKKDCRWRHSFRDGLALTYAENNRHVFINEQCEEVFRLAPDIQTDGYFSEGLVLAYKVLAGEKIFGYLDRQGNAAIDFKFAEAAPFSDGLAGVVIKEKAKQFNAYINPKGEIVLKNTRGIAPFKNGLAFQYLYTWTISERPNGRNIKGYMNKQGKYVWLSPRAENYLEKDRIKQNYIGKN